MRVIGGTLGGRQLLAPKGRQVRPTSARAREAVFAVLGDITGRTVLDLFCGTGAYGIEAISRGAARAVMVDRDVRPAAGNLRYLGIEGQVDLVRAAVTEWLPTAGESFDLVFIDPPWRLDPEGLAVLDRALPGVLAPGGRVVLESSARRPLELPSLFPVRERRYGRTLITFLQADQNE